VSAKTLFRGDFETPFVARAQTEQQTLETFREIAVANHELRGRAREIAVHHGAVGQLDGEMQHDRRTRSNRHSATVAHACFRRLRKASRIRSAAPTVMAESATLNAGQ